MRVLPQSAVYFFVTLWFFVAPDCQSIIETLSWLTTPSGRQRKSEKYEERQKSSLESSTRCAHSPHNHSIYISNKRGQAKATEIRKRRKKHKFCGKPRWEKGGGTVGRIMKSKNWSAMSKLFCIPNSRERSQEASSTILFWHTEVFRI